MISGKFQDLPIHDIELDIRNPRIRRLLEYYQEDSITEEALGLALNSYSTENDGPASNSATPVRLRESIVANRGIRQPIIVNRHRDGRMVCIEGNTRLYIYRDLHKNEAEGDWSNIPALVHDELEGESIDAIRLQAHLVGPRPWDAYSKARYLHELQNKEHMSLTRIVALCGGSERDVVRSIQAYADMEAFYRPLCKAASEFDVERFSGFVEFQAPRVQDAIFRHGFDGTDFAKWIKDKSRIGSLAEVRQLPAVLNDEKAKEIFLKKNMKEAVKVLDRPAMNTDLQNASLAQLARALETKAGQTSMQELRAFREEDDGHTLRHIDLAIEALEFLRTEIDAGS